ALLGFVDRTAAGHGGHLYEVALYIPRRPQSPAGIPPTEPRLVERERVVTERRGGRDDVRVLGHQRRIAPELGEPPEFVDETHALRVRRRAGAGELEDARQRVASNEIFESHPQPWRAAVLGRPQSERVYFGPVEQRLLVGVERRPALPIGRQANPFVERREEHPLSEMRRERRAIRPVRHPRPRRRNG